MQYFLLFARIKHGEGGTIVSNSKIFCLKHPKKKTPACVIFFYFFFLFTMEPGEGDYLGGGGKNAKFSNFPS